MNSQQQRALDSLDFEISQLAKINGGKGRRFLLERRETEQKARKADIESSQQLISRKKESGISERCLNASLKNFRADSNAQADELTYLTSYLKQVLHRQETSLAILGPVGTGKTWIGSALVADVLATNENAAIIAAKQYTGLIRDSYRPKSERGEIEILRHFSRLRLLVIDELGRQHDSEAERLYLFNLVDERYKNRLPTVFLSNLGIENFREVLGEAILDRIRETSGRIRHLNWPSRRSQT